MNSADWKQGFNISINDEQDQAPLVSIEQITGTFAREYSFLDLWFEPLPICRRFGEGALGLGQEFLLTALSSFMRPLLSSELFEWCKEGCLCEGRICALFEAKRLSSESELQKVDMAPDECLALAPHDWFLYSFKNDEQIVNKDLPGMPNRREMFIPTPPKAEMKVNTQTIPCKWLKTARRSEG